MREHRKKENKRISVFVVRRIANKTKPNCECVIIRVLATVMPTSASTEGAKKKCRVTNPYEHTTNGLD